MKKQQYTLFIATLLFGLACSKDNSIPASYQITECWLNDSMVFIPSEDTTDLYFNTKKSCSFALKSTAPTGSLKTYYRLIGEKNYTEFSKLIIDSSVHAFDFYLGNEQYVHDKGTIVLNRFDTHLLDSLQPTNGVIYPGKLNLTNNARGYLTADVYNRWGEHLKDTIAFKNTEAYSMLVPYIDSQRPAGVYLIVCKMGDAQKAIPMTKLD